MALDEASRERNIQGREAIGVLSSILWDASENEKRIYNTTLNGIITYSSGTIVEETGKLFLCRNRLLQEESSRQIESRKRIRRIMRVNPYNSGWYQRQTIGMVRIYSETEAHITRESRRSCQFITWLSET